MLPRIRWLVLLLLLCAGFADERAVIASSLVVIWHACNSEDLTFNGLYKWLAFFAGFLALYLFVRVAVGYATGQATPSVAVGLDIFRLNLPNIVLLVWSVFEGGWLVVFIAAFALNDKRTGPHAALLVGCLIGLAAVWTSCRATLRYY